MYVEEDQDWNPNQLKILDHAARVRKRLSMIDLEQVIEKIRSKFLEEDISVSGENACAWTIKRNLTTLIDYLSAIEEPESTSASFLDLELRIY